MIGRSLNCGPKRGIGSGHVGRGEDGSGRRGRQEPHWRRSTDPCPRHRQRDELDVQLVGQVDVGDVALLTGDAWLAPDARDRMRRCRSLVDDGLRPVGLERVDLAGVDPWLFLEPGCLRPRPRPRRRSGRSSAATQIAGETLLDLLATRVWHRGAAGRRRPSAGRGCRNRTEPRPSRGRRSVARESARPSARPSTVVTSPPSASTAMTRHESTITPFSRTVHAPHSPTRQHSLVPVRSRSSRSASSSVWCSATDTERGWPFRRRSMITRSDSRKGGRERSKVRGRSARAASPGGSRAPHASTSDDGLASPNQSSHGGVPVASSKTHGRGPRLPYAKRVAPDSLTETARVTDARSCPRRRVRRWNADPRRDPSAGNGKTMAVTSSPAPSVVTPGPDEEVVQRQLALPGCPGNRPAARRRRGVAGRCPRQERHCIGCRRASRDCGSARNQRNVRPRPTRETSARSHPNRGCPSSSCRRRCAPSPPSTAIEGAVSGMRLTSITTSGAERPVAQPDDQVGAAGEDARLLAVL